MDAFEFSDGFDECVLGTRVGVQRLLRWRGRQASTEYVQLSPSEAYWVIMRMKERPFAKLRSLFVEHRAITICDFDRDFFFEARGLLQDPVFGLVLLRRARRVSSRLPDEPILSEPRAATPSAQTISCEVCLETVDGYRIPEAAFEVVFADGTRRTGRLDRNGAAVLADVPAGKYEIRYPNMNDVRAKGFAARLSHALQSSPPDWGVIYATFMKSGHLLDGIHRAYQSYFNVVSGLGMVHDIRSAGDGTEHDLALEHLASRLGKESFPPTSPMRVLRSRPHELRLDGARS